MNKKISLASLAEIANQLDEIGLVEEANKVTDILIKISQNNQPSRYDANQIVYMAFSKFFGSNFNSRRDVKQQLSKLGAAIIEEADQLASLYKVDQGEVDERMSKAFQNYGLNFSAILRNPKINPQQANLQPGQNPIYTSPNDVVFMAMKKMFGPNVNNSSILKKRLPQKAKELFNKAIELGNVYNVEEVEIENKLQDVYRNFGLDFYEYFYGQSV
jgi:hypothetical protein